MSEENDENKKSNQDKNSNEQPNNNDQVNYDGNVYEPQDRRLNSKGNQESESYEAEKTSSYDEREYKKQTKKETNEKQNEREYIDSNQDQQQYTNQEKNYYESNTSNEEQKQIYQNQYGDTNNDKYDFHQNQEQVPYDNGDHQPQNFQYNQENQNENKYEINKGDATDQNFYKGNNDNYVNDNDINKLETDSINQSYNAINENEIQNFQEGLKTQNENQYDVESQVNASDNTNYTTQNIETTQQTENNEVQDYSNDNKQGETNLQNETINSNETVNQSDDISQQTEKSNESIHTDNNIPETTSSTSYKHETNDEFERTRDMPQYQQNFQEEHENVNEEQEQSNNETQVNSNNTIDNVINQNHDDSEKNGIKSDQDTSNTSKLGENTENNYQMNQYNESHIPQENISGEANNVMINNKNNNMINEQTDTDMRQSNKNLGMNESKTDEIVGQNDISMINDSYVNQQGLKNDANSSESKSFDTENKNKQNIDSKDSNSNRVDVKREGNNLATENTELEQRSSTYQAKNIRAKNGKDKNKNEKKSSKKANSKSKDSKDNKLSSLGNSLVNSVSTASSLLKQHDGKTANESMLINAGGLVANKVEGKAVGLAKKGLQKVAGKGVNKAMGAVGSVISTVKNADGKELLANLIKLGIEKNPYVIAGVIIGIIVLAIVVVMRSSDENNPKEASSYNYVEPVKSYEDSKTESENVKVDSSRDDEETYNKIKLFSEAYTKLDGYFFSVDNKDEVARGLSSEINKSKSLFIDMFKNMIVKKEKMYDFYSEDKLFDCLYSDNYDSEFKDFFERDLKNMDDVVYSSEILGNDIGKKINEYREILNNAIESVVDEIKANSENDDKNDNDDNDTDIENIEPDKYLVKEKFLNMISGDSKILIPYYKKIFINELDNEIYDKIYVSSSNTSVKEKNELCDLMYMLYFLDNLYSIPSDSFDSFDYELRISDDELKVIASGLMNFKIDISWRDGQNNELKTLNYIFDNVKSGSESSVLLIKKMQQTLRDKFYEKLILSLDDSNVKNYDPKKKDDYLQSSLFENIYFIRSKVEKLEDKDFKSKTAYNKFNGQEKIYNPLATAVDALKSQWDYISQNLFGDHYRPVSFVANKNYIHVVKNLLPGTDEIDLTKADKIIGLLSRTGHFETKSEVLRGLDEIESFLRDLKIKLEAGMEKNNLILDEIVSSIGLEVVEKDENTADKNIFRINSDTTLESIDVDENKIKKQIIDNKTYFLVDDVVDIEKINIERLPLDFENWFNNSYFRKKVLENPVYDFFNANANDENIGRYDYLKNLISEALCFIYPVLNHDWFKNQNSGYGIVYDNENVQRYNDFMELKFDSPENIYSVHSGIVLDKGDKFLKIKCESTDDPKKYDDSKKNQETASSNNMDFYVEYEGLIPDDSLEIGSKIFRYTVPYGMGTYSTKKTSTVIGMADQNENLKVKCYFSSDEGDLVINPYLFILGHVLPEKDYVPPKVSPSPTSETTTTPKPALVYVPTPTPEPTPMPEPSPIGKVLHRDVLLVFAEITRIAGMLFAVWSLIKFALGLHDYESANYQAIWQFVAASILIFGAMVLKYIAKL